jgi:hypothetical protein
MGILHCWLRFVAEIQNQHWRGCLPQSVSGEISPWRKHASQQISRETERDHRGGLVWRAVGTEFRMDWAEFQDDTSRFVSLEKGKTKSLKPDIVNILSISKAEKYTLRILKMSDESKYRAIHFTSSMGRHRARSTPRRRFETWSTKALCSPKVKCRSNSMTKSARLLAAGLWLKAQPILLARH